MFSDTLIQTDSFHGQGVHPVSGKIVDITDFVGCFETIVTDHDSNTTSLGNVIVERTNSKARQYHIGESLTSINIFDGSHNKDGIGANIWLSSFPLSLWITQNKSFFYDRKVLEIGCGVGLCGLYLASLPLDIPPKCIVLSDYTDGLKQSFQANKHLNNQSLQHQISYQTLNWYDTFKNDYDTSSAINGPYDIILATDCIYKSTCASFKQAIMTNLAVGGTLLMVNPIETSRPGVDAFIYSLAECGEVSVEHVQVIMNSLFKKTFLFVKFERTC